MSKSVFGLLAENKAVKRQAAPPKAAQNKGDLKKYETWYSNVSAYFIRFHVYL